MARNILIAGASYGSLMSTKLAMAGHNATLICRDATAQLINREGTETRIKLRDEDTHRAIRSVDLPGNVNATTPNLSNPEQYDLVVLAMQEPQFCHPELQTLLDRIAAARVPCLSIMNMPPLPFLKRIKGLETAHLHAAYTDASIWNNFDPELVTLCSPDPQAFRPPDTAPNVLHVGLPTNFKASGFSDPALNGILLELERDIEAVRLEGKDVPVKLRVHSSLFVPLAKWSMLLTGNYRCITETGPRSINDAVHSDLDTSREIYAHVDAIARALGADPADLVPFEKYANAARNLLKPSSAARAVASGASIERVDKLVQLIGQQIDLPNPAIDRVVARVDTALVHSKKSAA